MRTTKEVERKSGSFTPGVVRPVSTTDGWTGEIRVRLGGSRRRKSLGSGSGRRPTGPLSGRGREEREGEGRIGNFDGRERKRMGRSGGGSGLGRGRGQYPCVVYVCVRVYCARRPFPLESLPGPTLEKTG